MKINYIAIGYPKAISPPLTDDGQTFISLLEDDEYFENKVKLIRDTFHISLKEGYIETDTIFHDYFTRFKKSNLEDTTNKEIIAINNLVKEYKLATVWNYSLFSYIFYGFMILFPEPQTIEIKDDRQVTKEYQISDDPITWVHPNDDVHLIIHTRTNKTDLINTIKKWPNIDKLLGSISLPKSLYPKLNIPNLETYRLIYKLKKEGKKSPQIADKLTMVYKKGFSDSSIRDMHSTYLEHIRNLRQTAVSTK